MKLPMLPIIFIALLLLVPSASAGDWRLSVDRDRITPGETFSIYVEGPPLDYFVVEIQDETGIAQRIPVSFYLQTDDYGLFGIELSISDAGSYLVLLRVPDIGLNQTVVFEEVVDAVPITVGYDIDEQYGQLTHNEALRAWAFVKTLAETFSQAEFLLLGSIVLLAVLLLFQNRVAIAGALRQHDTAFAFAFDRHTRRKKQ